MHKRRKKKKMIGEEELRRRKLLGKKMRFFCRGEEKWRRIWREIFEPKQDKRTTD